MRQRKAKNMEERLQALSYYMIQEPTQYKGRWRELFEDKEELYLELGCGKGQFLMGQAERNPQAGFIGIEGQDSVMLRAMEKIAAEEIVTIRFVHMFVRDIRDLFQNNELSGIYLNFSDPWPKKRHAKRRLTYGEYLKQYKEVISSNGFIAFKTDNEGLFDFTLEEIHRLRFEIREMSRDLHNSQYEAKDITTEYEDKFRAQGKPIYYVKL